MSIINGGDVMAISKAREYELLPDRKKAAVLVNGKAKHFQHLVDRMVLVNPDLRVILSYVNNEVSNNWYKTIRGRIITLMLTRCMVFQMNPVHYKYRMELLLYANYSIIKNYLQRIVKVLINSYGLPNKYYKLFIPQNELYKLSQLWADEMYETSLKMVIHYDKLHPKVD